MNKYITIKVRTSPSKLSMKKKLTISPNIKTYLLNFKKTSYLFNFSELQNTYYIHPIKMLNILQSLESYIIIFKIDLILDLIMQYIYGKNYIVYDPSVQIIKFNIEIPILFNNEYIINVNHPKYLLKNNVYLGHNPISYNNIDSSGFLMTVLEDPTSFNTNFNSNNFLNFILDTYSNEIEYTLGYIIFSNIQFKYLLKYYLNYKKYKDYTNSSVSFLLLKTGKYCITDYYRCFKKEKYILCFEPFIRLSNNNILKINKNILYINKFFPKIEFNRLIKKWFITNDLNFEFYSYFNFTIDDNFVIHDNLSNFKLFNLYGIQIKIEN